MIRCLREGLSHPQQTLAPNRHLRESGAVFFSDWEGILLVGVPLTRLAVQSCGVLLIGRLGGYLKAIKQVKNPKTSRYQWTKINSRK